MRKYDKEMRHKNEYDFLVINDKLENCVNEIETIIKNNRKINGLI